MSADSRKRNNTPDRLYFFRGKEPAESAVTFSQGGPGRHTFDSKSQGKSWKDHRSRGIVSPIGGERFRIPDPPGPDTRCRAVQTLTGRHIILIRFIFHIF